MRAIALLMLWPIAFLIRGDEPSPKAGPATEKRFPPLKVPPGFKATLFACDPLIEYPSVIAIGPKPGSLFVAIDYMTGLGTEIVRRSEIRLIEDTDGDGYADKSTVYAKDFNSIQGLAYHDGTVYVMHAPFLTALRDTKGKGEADERKDLLTGLGLTPEENPVRLHCANGVVVGHDGWLYLALGDHGCDVKRPEGDRLVLEGGGILRCRPDGRDLHIFATGLRNIYDIALDEDLNVFVRDNENDGGTYMIRVCHSFFGADHGYPYLYYERPDEALPPLADLGLGSSAGGVCYLETQFPPEYRGNLFFCEWGKSVVRYMPKREGSGFGQLKEIEFATGADDDPYGFKPTDLVVDRDGSLFVSDWADGQRPKRGRGRIYRITYEKEGPRKEEPKDAIARLDSRNYEVRAEAQLEIERRGKEGLKEVREALAKKKLGVRGRLHAVWLLARSGSAAHDELVEMVRSDPEPRVQAQAMRAIADLTDPVFVKHRVNTGAGDSKVAKQLADLAKGKDPLVVREIVIALSRLRWTDAPGWLHKNISKPDAALGHAAMMTLRKCDNWPEVLKLLDLPDSESMRSIALRACAQQYSTEIVDGLIERLHAEKQPRRKQEYADLLTRVYKKPGKWVYWGYRPPPRPANTEKWEKTEAIEPALDRVIGDTDKSVSLAILERMKRERIPVRLTTLTNWLRDETQAEPMLAILGSLKEQPAAAIREHLELAAVDKKKALAGRLAALSLFAGGLIAENESRLLTLSKAIEDGPVLAEAFRLLAKRPQLKSWALLLEKVDSSEPTVRAAAIDALSELKVADAAKPLQSRLGDLDAGVRRAAAAAAGKLGIKDAADSLLKLARDPDAGVRRAIFESLRLLKEPRVVPIAVAALSDPETQLAALGCVTELGGPEQAKALIEFARQQPSIEVQVPVQRALTKWDARDSDWQIAELHGSCAMVICWRVAGPMANDPEMVQKVFLPIGGFKWQVIDWQITFGGELESRIRLKHGKGTDEMWLATAEIQLPEKADVQFLLGSSAGYRFWINSKQVQKRDEAQPYRVDSDRFDAVLEKGTSKVLLQFPSAKSDIDFHLRFRRKSASASHEKLTQAALTRSGNVENGRKLFFNAEKTQCIKCHRVGDQGEKIGPELTGVGNRFSRIHIVESILEPSRTIAAGFQSEVVTLADGKKIIGVKIAEAETTLTFADDQAKKHEIAKKDVESRRPQAASIMPEGLEKPLTVDEFVDLIAFLAAQKDVRPR
jgi:putative membrane-bound dehydrogenase-like protein